MYTVWTASVLPLCLCVNFNQRSLKVKFALRAGSVDLGAEYRMIVVTCDDRMFVATPPYTEASESQPGMRLCDNRRPAWHPGSFSGKPNIIGHLVQYLIPPQQSCDGGSIPPHCSANGRYLTTAALTVLTSLTASGQ